MLSLDISRKQEILRVCKIIEEQFDYQKHCGVLICEGEENSIDVKLYSRVYTSLLVIPGRGCTDVVRLLPSIRKRNEDINVFGLIDRDSNSKEEIKHLQRDKAIYCTKLPFIENIICTPEVIKILCTYMGIDYKPTIKRINERVMRALSEKIKNALPVNMSISANELVNSISFTITKENKEIITKTVNERSILYTYRDKAVASIVADTLTLNGRQGYYDFVAQMIENPAVSSDIVKAASAYLPIIEPY